MKDETDEKQFRHRRYQLFFKDIRVEGVEYMLHDRNNRLESANGRIVEGLAIDVINPIDERLALLAALTDQKLSLTSFTDLSLLPKGELVIAATSQNFVKENFSLCYAFDVALPGSPESYRIFVDARSRAIIRRLSLFANCLHEKSGLSRTTPDLVVEKPVADGLPATNPPVIANFVPNYSRYLDGRATLNFETHQFGSSNSLYILNTQLNTRIDVQSTGQWAGNPDVQSPSLAWGNTASNATTAHWLTEQMYQYYQVKHGRNGYDGNGTYPRVLVNVPINNFAQWDQTQNTIRVGFLSGRSLVTADVIGHEYAHAVMQYTAGLIYAAESGAIDESIADIMGTALERQLLPNANANQWDWTLGEDAFPLRSMSNPGSFGDPANFANLLPIVPPCNGGNDFCEVHSNSGIMNKWFHNLASGGAMSIPFDNATDIVYKAQRYYMNSTSDYADVRDATWFVAGAFYGQCSDAQKRVAASWRAVGLNIEDCPPGCDYKLGSIVVSNAVCNQTMNLSVNCTGTSVACNSDIIYLWDGPTQFNSNTGQATTTTAPATAGSYTYSVTGSKGGCTSNTSTIAITINCNPSQPCIPVASGNCYTIKVQKNGLRLQVMSDGTIQQQNANNQNDQLWKLDDVGGSAFRFTTQDGTNRVVTSNSGNFGEWLNLSGYSGANGQKWYLQCNNTNNHYRVYRDNAVTWDVKDYGTSPQLQLYGTTSDSFFDYRSFEFQPATCPTGTPPPPPPSGNLTIVAPAYNCQTGALTVQTSGGNGSSVEYQILGLGGWSSSSTFTVPSHQQTGTTFTLQARQSGVEAASYQYITACGGTTPPPTGGTFTINYPSLNCSDGNLTLSTSGGNGSTIEYRCVGLTDWTTTNVLNIPSYQRNGTSFTIQARQSGVEANPLVYTTGCAGYRLAAVDDEPVESLVVLPNPTTGRVTVRFWLKTGQAAVLHVTNTLGVEVGRRAIVGTGRQQEESINLDRELPGIYLLNLQSGSKRVTGKVLLQR